MIKTCSTSDRTGIRHLNAAFQWFALKDKESYYNKLCKAMEGGEKRSVPQIQESKGNVKHG